MSELWKAQRGIQTSSVSCLLSSVFVFRWYFSGILVNRPQLRRKEAKEEAKRKQAEKEARAKMPPGEWFRGLKVRAMNRLQSASQEVNALLYVPLRLDQ